MLKLINAWRERNRSRRDTQQPAEFNEQLLADLELTWDDVMLAKAAHSCTYGEGAVFP